MMYQKGDYVKVLTGMYEDKTGVGLNVVVSDLNTIVNTNAIVYPVTVQFSNHMLYATHIA